MKNIGRYTIQGRLGRGGMSTVYKAIAPVTGRTVALKVLLPRDDIFVDLVGKSRLEEIFVEEARIMGEISHDHVAKILDCDYADEAPFIVLEYFAHSIGTLIGEAYQVEKPSRIISIKKTYHYLRQSLCGLERLHFAGIIHRDIKPFNLMLTNDDRVKIIDFGLSRVRGEEKMAIPGMQVGSPYYAAPEQENNPKNADERSDLYSLGIMAYRMLTGQLADIREKNITPPSALNPELNDHWDELLLKSISNNPESRHNSAHEMRSALEQSYSLWVKESQKSCGFMALDTTGPSLGDSKVRMTPAFIRYKNLKESFGLDSLMRPAIFPAHRFEFKNELLIYCMDTKSLWQRQGSGFPVSWSGAHEYIQYLNKISWQGYSEWRLPTLAELRTLLRPPTLLRDFCLENLISNEIHWLWSSDTCTKKMAWSVDIQECFYQPLDKDGMASVCAICTE